VSDPNTQHNICPGCHTHKTVNRATGRFVVHNTLDPHVLCVGSGERPVADTDSRYAVGSQYESCPAATGDGARCPHFPDSAHRCSLKRQHVTGHAFSHRCTCGVAWVSLTADDARDIEIVGHYYGGKTASVTVTAKDAT
jgi:hypothetical protein